MPAVVGVEADKVGAVCIDFRAIDIGDDMVLLDMALSPKFPGNPHQAKPGGKEKPVDPTFRGKGSMGGIMADNRQDIVGEKTCHGRKEDGQVAGLESQYRYKYKQESDNHESSL